MPGKVPVVCRRVDSHPAPNAAVQRALNVTIERCVSCGAAIYVSGVIREHTDQWHCDRCAPPEVRDVLRRLGVPNV